MKKCEYCGKMNESSESFCAGCGTNLPELKTNEAPPKRKAERTLNARFANFILLIYIGVNVACAFVTAVLAVVLLRMQGHEAIQPDSVRAQLEPFLTVQVHLLSLVVIFLTSRKLLPKYLLQDTSPCGAAWVLGRSVNIAKGLVIGILAAAIIHFMNKIVPSHVIYHTVRPMTWEPTAPWQTQVMLCMTYVLVAPVVEEMLFRGILYGGYRKSLGATRAAIFSTLIFLLFHPLSILGSTTAIVAIVGIALTLLWCRLRWNAIGPAIAAHVGYNALLVFTGVYVR